MSARAPLRLFQIFHDAPTRAALDADFEPLDNAANERPDWYEYWPILRTLSAIDLDAPGRYGFFSPKFARKTGLAGAQVRAFAEAAGDAALCTFSTFPEHGAYFLNVFEQGDTFHPGLWRAAQFVAPGLWGIASLDALVNHSRDTVFANFFVAPAAFWKRWRGVVERVFRSAETPGDPLHAMLTAATMHHGTTLPQMKIFLLERTVSALLASDAAWTTAAYQPLRMTVSHPYFEAHFDEIVQLDALKLAYAGTRDPHFLQAFRSLQRGALTAGDHPWRDAWAARARH
jgi:hypothetical protein